MAFDFSQVSATKSEFDSALGVYEKACADEAVAQDEFDAAQAKLDGATAARQAADVQLEYKLHAMESALAALDIVAQPEPEPLPEPSSSESSPPDPTPEA